MNDKTTDMDLLALRLKESFQASAFRLNTDYITKMNSDCPNGCKVDCPGGCLEGCIPGGK
ncbi:hypothetical protein DFR58_1086 [Anaerobacterium chartisolvens]|uniref:Uncharacterized protein n=1 Tax=Anaerobacterium chartisolvens TaxID=1297424 RepID=A0A369B6H5_9FIRM|nr:hypothetical protein [Anaerobacterium chartisolvens]RCX17113.1 hypothetical protein DFR58_1086 [Anaerobacterium chartisolvens]